MGVPTPAAASDGAGSPGTQWLDVRVIYVRLSAPAVTSGQAPERLVLRCAPRDIRSELEMNGARIPPSEPASLTLRLDRADEDLSEAMYVSTDKLRLSSSLPFAIFHGEEQLVEGYLSCRDSHPPWSVGIDSTHSNHSSHSSHGASGNGDWLADPSSVSPTEPRTPRACEWGMRCACTVSANWSGFTIKSLQDFTTSQPVQPALEVCVVGKCHGASLMLTDQVQLLVRKRMQWKGGLVAIPETEENDKGLGMGLYGRHPGREDQLQLQHHGLESEGKAIQGRAGDDHGHGQQGEQEEQRQGLFLEGLWPTHAGLSGLYGDTEENGEMTWFNAGVRVGVGIGLGMCIGMGIGVGLIVRTYQGATRPFRGGRLL